MPLRAQCLCYCGVEMLFQAVIICLAACALAIDDELETNKDAKPSQTEGPVTITSSGTIRGSWMTSRRGRQFQAYRGIRYAEPPVGELRFQPPKLILNYDECVNATEDGPACPRLASLNYYIDEDCLTINVYTPDNNSSEPLPVIFFIHPGGFYLMSGRSNAFGPHYLLDKDVVLVTINYRLGTLGFISTGDELAPGNNGLKDQVAALKWVQRNIRAFGGNPDLVTIAGCSAGSTSVLLHVVSPMSKNLFHRAISSSGSPDGKAPLDEEQFTLARKQAELLNCTELDNSTDILECLQDKPWKDIGNSLPGFFEFGYDPIRIWKPVVETDFGQERFLTTQPVDAMRDGNMHAVPHMFSLVRNEFFWKAFTILKNETLLNEMNANWDAVAPISFELPLPDNASAAQRLRQEYLGGRPLANDTESAERLGKLYADAITGFNTHRMANLMSRHSPYQVFYAQFAYIGRNSFYKDSLTKKPTGVAHHDDLIYLFSMDARFPRIRADRSRDSKMVDTMTALWYNFAKYGDPNCQYDQPQLPIRWPAMTPSERQYLRIEDQLSVHARMFEDRLRVWDELYPIKYEEIPENIVNLTDGKTAKRVRA